MQATLIEPSQTVNDAKFGYFSTDNVAFQNVMNVYNTLTPPEYNPRLGRKEHTVKWYHDRALLYTDLAHEILRGRALGTHTDAIELYRISLGYEKKAFVLCRDKHSKRVLKSSYEGIQTRIRKLTW